MSQPAPSTTPVRDLRRIAVIGGIAALSIAAALGIFALLSGEFGELQFRVLFTALVVAGFCVVGLGNLTAYDRAPKVLPILGIVTGFIVLALALWLIWVDSSASSEWDDVEWKFRTLGVCLVLCILFTHAGLLIGLLRSGVTWIRAALAVTLLCSTALAAIVIGLILSDGEFAGEWTPRTIGILVILAALGSIALPIAHEVSRPKGPRAAGAAVAVSATASGSAPAVPPVPAGHPAAAGHASLELDAALLARLQERAAAEGVTVPELVERMLGAE